jgi:predicted RNase H-like nuclease (RuvC/YqgF family)
MKQKSSKPPEPQEGLKNPAARVSITEVAPDADQIVKRLTEEPARLLGVAKQLIRYSARLSEAAPLFRAAEKRAAAIGPGNELRKQKAKDLHQKIREVAQECERTRKQLQAELTKRDILSPLGKPVSTKMISRALNPKK